MSTVKYSIVIPCYNESDNLGPLTEKFRKFRDQMDFELLLVNNGSTDDSGPVLDSLLADKRNDFLRVVTIEKNIGYGHGIHFGLLRANGEVLAYTHADLQTPPDDAFRAFRMIEDGRVRLDKCVLKGYRVDRDKENFLTLWLSKIVNAMTGYNLVDINGQPKVFSSSFFKEFSEPPVDFAYDVYVLYKSALMGMDIATFDVSFGERIHGESKWASRIIGKYRTILSYLKSILVMSWRNREDGRNPIGRFTRLIPGMKFLLFRGRP